MNGAPSQVDTFDPKPELETYDGTGYSGKVKVGSNGRPIGKLMKAGAMAVFVPVASAQEL